MLIFSFVYLMSRQRATVELIIECRVSTPLARTWDTVFNVALNLLRCLACTHCKEYLEIHILYSLQDKEDVESMTFVRTVWQCFGVSKM